VNSGLLTGGLQRPRSIGVGLYAPFLPSVVGCIVGQRWSICACAAGFPSTIRPTSRRWLRRTFACKRQDISGLKKRAHVARNQGKERKEILAFPPATRSSHLRQL